MLQNNFKTEPLIIPLGEKRIFGELFSPTDGEKHPAVIFVHGYNSCYADFRGECEAFASNGFIAYALDFCGGSDRSKSSGLSTDMSVLTEKEELLAVIDYFAAMENVLPGKLFLLGGSQGGLVSGLAAEERRDVLGGMILYFPAYMIPDNWRPRFPTVEDIPEVLEFWGLRLGRRFFLDMRDLYTYEHVGGFSKPILIFQGDADQIVPLSSAEKTAKAYPNAKLVVLPGEGHGFSEKAIGGVIEQSLAFLNALL